MTKVVASAPGKVILFGEHAVVHGITAVAAALSDLRIFVELVSLHHTFLFHSKILVCSSSFSYHLLG